MIDFKVFGTSTMAWTVLGDGPLATTLVEKWIEGFLYYLP
jgi:hypothetical protein